MALPLLYEIANSIVFHQYYDRMTEVRNKDNYEQWIKVFLSAIYESAEDAINTIDKLTILHDKNVAVIKEFERGAKTGYPLFFPTSPDYNPAAVYLCGFRTPFLMVSRVFSFTYIVT